MPRPRPYPGTTPAPLDKVFDALKDLAASGLTSKKRVLSGRRKRKAPPTATPSLPPVSEPVANHDAGMCGCANGRDPTHRFSQFLFSANKAPTQRALADAVYELMDDVTKKEATKVARTVLDGYDGDAAVEDVAKELRRKLGFDDARSLAVATTETTRVRAADGLSSAAESGLKSVKFRAHAGACPECQRLNGRKFSLSEAQHKIPVHPHCECGWDSNEPVANEEHSFASTHYDVTDPVVTVEVDRLRATLDPADVTKIPNDLHVTVLYGLEELDPARVKLLLSEAGTPFARVGPLSLFRNSDADVLKFDLDSPQLHALHRRLRLLPHTLTHPEYQPHVTVAYLEPGTGDKYVNLPQQATGQEVTLTKFVYSTRDGDGRVLNRSYFDDCPRDKTGRCLPSEHGGTLASKPEVLASATRAVRKVNAAPVPDPAKVGKMRGALERAKTDPKARQGGDARGNSEDRRRRALALFKEFGGDERGYVVCPWTGIKMHWAPPADKANNPRGYPKFEQGKIFTACQGGGYTLDNLVPESFTANRKRNDIRLRKENSRGC